MMLMNVEAFGKKFPLLCSISFVNVNNRLVFVYGYRRLTSDNDAEILRDFTKKWTTDIIAANKIVSARNQTEKGAIKLLVPLLPEGWQPLRYGGGGGRGGRLQIRAYMIKDEQFPDRIRSSFKNFADNEKFKKTLN